MYEARLAVSCTLSGSGRFTGSLASSWTPDFLTVSSGYALTLRRDLGAGTATYTVSVNGTAITGTYSEAVGLTVAPETTLEFDDLKLYTMDDALWRVTCSAVRWYVNGTLRGSWGAQTLDGTMVPTPCSIPVFGMPPILSAEADVVTASGSASGGWRFKQGGTWFELPVTLDRGPGLTTPCPCTATVSLAVGGTTYTCEAGAAVSSADGPGRSWIMCLPDLEKGVVRMNPVDYAALVYRGEMPETTRRRSISCLRPIAAGDPPFGEIINVTDEIHPSMTEFPSTVRAAAHVIEDPMGWVTYAPFYEQGKKVCGSPPDGGTPITNAYEREFPYTVEVNTMAYLGHDNKLVRYLNTVACPHWSYLLWFPPESASAPIGWEISGSVATPQEYWLYVRSQHLTHPALPVGEDLRIRNDIVSEPLFQGGLAGLIEGQVLGQVSSWWGISAFQVDQTSLPASKSTDGTTDAAWSAVGATLAVGTDIVATPSALSFTVDLDLGRFDLLPWQYPHTATEIEVNWSATNVSAMDVCLVGIDGTEVSIGTAPGTYARPAGSETEYAGSWVIDHGVGHLADAGSDSLGSGISAATMADAERSFAPQLLPGRTAQKLRFKVTATALSAVTINHPEFHRPVVTAEKVFAENAPFADVVSENGPGWRWGQWNYWVGAWTDPPVVYGRGAMPTVLDWLGFRRHALEGKAADDGLDTEIATLYENGVEYTLRKHLASDPFNDVPLTHAFMVQGLTRWAACLVNSYAETPPIAWFPQASRDGDFVPGSGHDQLAYSYCPARRTIVCPSLAGLVSSASILWRDGSTTTDVPGWAIGWHERAVDGSEGIDWTVRVGSIDYAEVRPWHSMFGVLPPLDEGSGIRVAYSVDPSFGVHIKAECLTGEVKISRSDNRIIWGTAINTGILAESVSLSVDPYLKPLTIWLAVESAAGNVDLYSSTDFGGTWTLSSTYGAGKKPAVLVGRDGRRYVYFENGGDLKGCIKDPSGATIEATFTARAGIDSEGCGVDESMDGGERRLHLVVVEAGIVTEYNSPDGKTFT